MKKEKKFWPRVSKFLVVFVCLVLFLYYGVLPLGFAYKATRQHTISTSQNLPGYEKVSLQTSDNVRLSAYYREPTNNSVIILVHGAGGNKEGMMNYSYFLAQEGYGILAIDLRGHGESEGKTNLFGWKGTADIEAAVNFLKQKNKTSIGAIGSSLGGEVLLGAANNYPEIKAIATDGATSRFFGDFNSLKFTSQAVQNTSYLRAQDFWVRTLSKDKVPGKTIVESIRDSEDTKFLFIAGAKRDMEPEYNQMFAREAEGRGDLWIVPEAGHTQAFSVVPDEYKNRLISFFKEKLLIK